MEVNNYALEMLVRDRLAELRAAAVRSARIRAARPESRPLRTALSRALDQVRQRLHSVVRSSRVAIGPRRKVDAERSSRHGAVRG